jgi:nitrogenase iron protein NifH
MQTLVVFGKGGVGKTTLSANLSASLAGSGHRVLHVGCDPKHDSTLALMDGAFVPAIAELTAAGASVSTEQLVARSRLGVDCIEAGGPTAGVGCGGRAVSRMVDIVTGAGLLSGDHYDAVVFDVLGDLICGGFTTPLRRGIADKVIIVASEELMALYAANNIAKAVAGFASTGTRLAGIVFVLKDNQTDRDVLSRFADRIGAPTLAFLPFDPMIRAAEYQQRTVVEHAPESAAAARYRELADRLFDCNTSELTSPRPMSDREFRRQVKDRFASKVPPRSQPQSNASPARPRPRVLGDAQSVALFERATGLRLRSVRLGVHGTVELAVEVADGPAVQVSLLPPNAPAQIHAPQFGIVVHGERTPDGLMPLLRRFARRFARVPFKRLRSHVTVDPADRHMLSLDDPESVLRGYGGSRAWHQFLTDNEPARRRGEVLTGEVVVVLHADQECACAMPPENGGVPSFFSSLPAPRTTRPNCGETVVCDLRNHDVVNDPDASLDAALQTISETRAPSAVVLRTSCLSKMLGCEPPQDMGEAFGFPVLSMSHDGGGEAVRKIMASVDLGGKTLVANRINILGFPAVAGESGVFALLAACGIEVGSRVLPDLDIAALEDFGCAALNVIYPWAPQHGTATWLASRVASPQIHPPAPFGLAATKSFLRAIAEPLGLGPRMQQVIDERWSGLEDSWKRVRARAKRYRLGFVVGEGNPWQEALSPTRCMGVPILSLVEEMGFSADILVRSTRGRCSCETTQDGRRLFEFDTVSALERLLIDSDAGAFYSDLTYDRRLTRTGHGLFSLQDIRCGFEGALATAHKLIACCRTTFYREQGRYLGHGFGHDPSRTGAAS